jgi:hypothetical protein
LQRLWLMALAHLGMLPVLLGFVMTSELIEAVGTVVELRRV